MSEFMSLFETLISYRNIQWKDHVASLSKGLMRTVRKTDSKNKPLADQIVVADSIQSPLGPTEASDILLN